MAIFASGMAQSSANIITTAPEGTAHEHAIRTGISLFNFDDSYLSGMQVTNNEAAVGSFIEGNDGNVYLKDPFCAFPMGTYMKLEKANGDTLVAHLPQPIEDLSGTTYYVAKRVARADANGYMGYFVDHDSINNVDNNDVLFTLKDGTLKQIDDDEVETTGGHFPKTVLALVNEDGDWFCFADGKISLTEFNDTAVTPPDGAEQEEYVYDYTDDPNSKAYSKVNVVKDGNDVYVNAAYGRNKKMWFKGRIEGAKAVFKKHYMGIDDSSNENGANDVHLFFVPFNYTDKGIDSLTYEEIYDRQIADSIVLDYDSVANTFKAPSRQGYAVSVGDKSFNTKWVYNSPEWFLFKEVPATPAAPVITDVQPYNGSCGLITFRLPVTDKDGNYITSDKLYYNLYYDTPDSPFVFKPSEYVCLEDTMTDVPYSYSDGYDFFCSSSITVYTYNATYTRIGVQSIYKGGNETHRSDIVWADNPATGISSISSNQPATTEYYDFSGRKISRPTSGLYIERTKYANGRTVTKKVIRK